ncbi:MAG: hypothetical protein RL625_1185 [Gemmatimonadota bacterium]|jgi:hypothetical protein
MPSLTRATTSFALVALTVLTAACVDTLEPSKNRFGLVSYTAFRDEVRGFVMDPEAVFYDRTDLRYTPPPADSCVLAAYTPAVIAGSSFPTLSAGEFLLTQVGAQRDSMRGLVEFGAFVYRPVRKTGIPFTPGDTVSVQIPGSTTGFPAATVALRTAEAFTADSVRIPEGDQDLALSWTAAPVAGSLMTVSLRYGNAFSNGQLNEQVFCGFTDDGAGTIRAALLIGWRTAAPTLRETRIIRLRSKELQIDPQNTLTVISSFGIPTAAFGGR